MAATQELAPPDARWDLSVLFDSITDPRIEEHWKAVFERAKAFAERYRGKINTPDLTAATLAEALREIENISREASKPLNYAHLVFAADTSNPAHGAFMQKQQEKGTSLSVTLMFFELELQAVPEDRVAGIIGDAALENYRHYVQVARAFSPFRLSEAEEIVLEEMANTGSRAWIRLFDETMGSHAFKYKGRAGDEQTLSMQEVVALLRDPDRSVRQAAADSLSAGLLELQKLVSYTYNTLIQDKAVEDRMRGLDYPEQSRHLANELDKETVDLVMRLCQEHYSLVERFYNVKREILGLPELTHIDRYAPLFQTKEQVGYEEAREIILNSFRGFSPVLAERADEFFQKSWIDAEPRKGKRGGAFCSYITPDTHPVILMTYLNKMDDVMTLAHELGHGVHSSLSRDQTYFNYHGTLPLAELASTFAEMLVFEKVVASADLKDKLALYAEKVEGTFATIFRQSAMFSFERRVHEARRQQGELTGEQINSVWQAELQKMFGASVKLGDQHSGWWTYVSHFVHVPFYVYAYSFGELLVLSLYEMAKSEGPSFADKYVRLLRLGGSKSPAELMQTVGVDIKSETFWQGGFAAMEKLVSEFERLWAEYK